MRRPLVLFRGTHKSGTTRRNDPPEFLDIAEPLAAALGVHLMKGGFDLLLTGSGNLETLIGEAAARTRIEAGHDPRERIRTYRERGKTYRTKGIGMVMASLARSHGEFRTLCVKEANAVIALVGGDGTSDCIQLALLARKPVFPIAVAGGAAQTEWDSLKARGYQNRVAGDIDFLADELLDPERMAVSIASQCGHLLVGESPLYPRKVFIVHGHDSSVKDELELFLSRLDFEAVVLQQDAEKGRTIIEKLSQNVSEVGFAFVIYTPDDVGSENKHPRSLKPRARQNVVFEHGYLAAKLGRERVCAILKDRDDGSALERYSDMDGCIWKKIPSGASLRKIYPELMKELRAAGYDLAPNALDAKA